MGDEFDVSIDTSFDDTSSDYSDAGDFDVSSDVGGHMDSPSDVGDISDSYSDIGSLMDDSADVGSIMDKPVVLVDFSDQPLDEGDVSDTPPDIQGLMDEPSDLVNVMDEYPDIADQQTIADDLTDIPFDVESSMHESSDTRSIMDGTDDVEPYHVTPNSDIPFLQEDGSVDSLENIMAANEDTGGALMDVEPYRATPNSGIQILQEDGTVNTLENIITATVETEATALDGDALEITPRDVVDGGGSKSLDEIMSENAESDSVGFEETDSGDVYVSEAFDTPENNIAPVDEEVDTTRNDVIDLSYSSDSIGKPIHMTQSDVEWYMENADDPESLRLMRDGIASGRIRIDADTELPSDDTIDNTFEAMSDDLRDRGMEDSPEMEAIVRTDPARMQDGLTRNINDDFSDPYQKPDYVELMQDIAADTPAQDIPGIEKPADTIDTTDSVSDIPMDIDYDAVYSGLDSYDFDGIDVGSNAERLDSSLDNFQSGTWENLSLDEQKAAMSELADYVKDVIGFDNPPEIVYYNNPVDGDYGGYSPSANALSVNEHMLYDNKEAADTVAHELWHAYQHERAMNPQRAKDYQYQYGFDNYFSPDDDFTAYQDQLVEAEARAFAQQFKDGLSTKRPANKSQGVD